MERHREPDPFSGEILSIGFLITLLPEAAWECAKDGANWLADKILDQLVRIDDNIQDF